MIGPSELFRQLVLLLQQLFQCDTDGSVIKRNKGNDDAQRGAFKGENATTPFRYDAELLRKVSISRGYEYCKCFCRP
jgi:hypothetical protein